MVEKKSLKQETGLAVKKTATRTVSQKGLVQRIGAGAESYAIFKSGGKQYQAIVGKTLSLEKLEGDAGQKITFNEVLLKKTGDVVDIGTPYVKGATITASIIKHNKDRKVIVFHFKRRKKSRVKRGHRQPRTIVRIEAI